ncbi:hypothetical protein HMPREF9370_0519 [Neisseria wadsworthii 9715]|uniref:Uncharacterized protein n=1 Tax=Neisseria wadsworthii 9715 TaxID=1030841 RepID=G4CN60_9NEIS|nr:hypothetical protein HMPREF9370_0519 [Neisseria wadsworthii 9715]
MFMLMMLAGECENWVELYLYSFEKGIGGLRVRQKAALKAARRPFIFSAASPPYAARH